MSPLLFVISVLLAQACLAFPNPDTVSKFWNGRVEAGKKVADDIADLAHDAVQAGTQIVVEASEMGSELAKTGVKQATDLGKSATDKGTELTHKALGVAEKTAGIVGMERPVKLVTGAGKFGVNSANVLAKVGLDWGNSMGQGSISAAKGSIDAVTNAIDDTNKAFNAGVKEGIKIATNLGLGIGNIMDKVGATAESWGNQMAATSIDKVLQPKEVTQPPTEPPTEPPTTPKSSWYGK